VSHVKLLLFGTANFLVNRIDFPVYSKCRALRYIKRYGSRSFSEILKFLDSRKARETVKKF